MLAGGLGVPPDPARYQFEPKFDGQRALAAVTPAGVTLTNRRGVDMTATYPELAGLAAALAPRSVLVDGEVVAFGDRGVSSFQRLQRRMHVRRPSARLLAGVPVVYVVFDVLWLDGDLLVGLRQDERRRVLEGLGLQGPAWQTAPVLHAPLGELLSAAPRVGLEGYMAKRLDSPYVPGSRTGAWWKVKAGRRRRDFVVGGWSEGHGSRQLSIGSLALGCHDVVAEEAARRGRPQRLFYVGQAGSGLTDDMIRQLRRLFEQIATATSPFDNVSLPALHFVTPLLVVDVEYSEVTESGTLRQPALKGLRTDVVADAVVWDDEIAPYFAGE
jgi:bifunctional non-homologous end joining protein LigD